MAASRCGTLEGSAGLVFSGAPTAGAAVGGDSCFVTAAVAAPTPAAFSASEEKTPNFS